MKLYGVAVSPYVMRVLLAARAKGTELSLEMMNGGLKTDAYLALNPIGKIPLLVDGDFTLPESQAIVDYLDAVLPGAPLVPGDARTAARIRLIVRLVDLYVAPELGGLFRGSEDPETAAAATARLTTAMLHIAHFRDAGDAWLVGDGFTAADAALLPLAFFFDAFHADAVLAADPGIAAWWDRAKASPIGSRALAEQAESMRVVFGKG